MPIKKPQGTPVAPKKYVVFNQTDDVLDSVTTLKEAQDTCLDLSESGDDDSPWFIAEIITTYQRPKKFVAGPFEYGDLSAK